MNLNFTIIKKFKYLWMITAGLALLPLFLLGHFQVKTIPENEGVWVETAQAKRGNIPVEIHVVGTLMAENQINITAELPGQVAAVLFKDGAAIKKGMPLFQLDDRIPQAQLAAAKADYDFSLLTYQRRAKLGKKGLWPVQEIDQAKADLEEKRALLQEKQATVDKLRLLAPFDGILGKAEASVGHYVTPGQSLVSLTNVRNLRAEFRVSEKYLSSLKLGQKIKITTSAYPDKVFEGEIAYISPTIEARDRTITLYALVPNQKDLLTAGMSVAITQTLGLQNNAVIVPAKSIMATLEGQEIYKIVKNKVYAVPVLLGQRNEDYVEILQGITEKDQIVIAGQHKLHDDMDVRIKL